MSIETNFHGIIPPVSIIFDQDGELDKKGMATVIDFLIDAGVDGLFFLGSGGEFSQMTKEQRIEVSTVNTKDVNGRVPVLIGTGRVRNNESIILSKHADKNDDERVIGNKPFY